MKPRVHSIKVATIAAIVSFGAISSSHAAIAVTWSGGNGAPLAFTLSAPVQFEMTATPSRPMIAFVMVGVGDLFGGNLADASGMTYSINRGENIDILMMSTGSTFGDVTPNDLVFFGIPETGPTIGDTIVLSPGPLTTQAGNYLPAPPADGSFNLFIVDADNATYISTAGVALVPEISSTLLGGLGLLSLLRRRR